MKTNKGSVAVILLILFMIAVIGGVTYYSSKTKSIDTPVSKDSSLNSEIKNTNLNTTSPTVPVNTPIGNTVTIEKTTASHCGFTINSPQPNSAIHSNVPVVFSGVINNSLATGCTWTMFEGEAGTAQLWHKDGGVWGMINSPKIITVTNWMTTGPVPFTVSVDFNNAGPGFVSGLPMKVVFTEENPSGEGVADTLEFPLIFQ